MFRKTTLMALALYAGTAGLAQAQDFIKSGPSVFNYNFVEGAYVDVDGTDGIALTGSGDVADNIAILVSYTRVSEGSADADGISFGGVYHVKAGNFPMADWVFSGGFERVEVTSGPFSDSDSGLFLSGGIRYGFSEAFEGNATLGLSTLGDTDIGFALRGLYNITPQLSAFAEADIGEDTAIGIGLRYYWR